MSDSNLDPSITSVTNRAVAVASTANPRELLNISRIGPSLEQTENANLEITLNARAQDLAPTATANELRSLGMAIGNLLEPQNTDLLMDWREGFVPDQRFSDGKFLRTSGSHQKSWGGVTTTTLDELELTSVATGESLVYNSASGKFENSSNTFAITVYAAEADLPAAPITGSLGYVTATSEVYYFNGSLWTIVQDVFSGIYRGNWQTNVLNNFASNHYPFANSGTIMMVDGTEATGGTTVGGDVDTTSRWASSVQNNFASNHYPFANSGTIIMVDGTQSTGGTTVGGSVDTTSRWAASHAGNSIHNNFGNSHYPFANSGTIIMVDGTEATGGTTAGGSVDTNNRWTSGNDKVYNLYNNNGVPSWNTGNTVLEISGTDVTTGTGATTSNVYALVSAYGEDTPSTNDGAAYIYDIANPTAAPTRVPNPTLATKDNVAQQFGQNFAVEPNGTRFAVGAYGEYVTPAAGEDSREGAVFIYDYANLSAEPVAILPPASVPGGRFVTGGIIWVGDQLIISNPSHHGGSAGGYQSHGAIMIYDTTDLSAAPTIMTGTIGVPERFGQQIAVEDGKLFVTDYLNAADGHADSYTGRLRAYNLSDLNEAPQDLTPSEVVGSSYSFAVQLMAKDGYVVLGAQGKNAIYVYDVSNLSAEPTKLTPLSGVGRYLGGLRSTIGGGKLFVGNDQAPAANGAVNGGRLEVYDLSNLAGGVQTTISAPDAEEQESWANCWAYGDTLIFSGYGDTENGQLYSGAYYIYDISDLTAAPTKVLNPTPDQVDSFAFQVAYLPITSTSSVVGGSIDTNNRWSSGNSKVYNLYYGHGVPSWNTSSTVIDE